MMRLKRLVVASFGLSLIALCLTSCGIQNEGNQQVEVSPPKVSSGTNGQLIPIQSDNVQSAGYDSISLTMKVQFRNGYIYEYYGVPVEVWESFLEAQPNPWSLVGYPKLVQTGVSYKRIR